MVDSGTEVFFFFFFFLGGVCELGGVGVEGDNDLTLVSEVKYLR